MAVRVRTKALTEELSRLRSLIGDGLHVLRRNGRRRRGDNYVGVTPVGARQLRNNNLGAGLGERRFDSGGGIGFDFYVSCLRSGSGIFSKVEPRDRNWALRNPAADLAGLRRC